ncbi:MAG: hypothetical protein Q4F49_01845 [Pseudoxanthomonas suwonensis]|nr:hypothetical protein [Pseudoxanthomonas suwonensis]
MNSPARTLPRIAAACLLTLPLLACGNKGPLTLAPRPAEAPAPVIDVDVPPPDVESADPVPLQEGEDTPPAQQDDDPR